MVEPIAVTSAAATVGQEGSSVGQIEYTTYELGQPIDTGPLILTVKQAKKGYSLAIESRTGKKVKPRRKPQNRTIYLVDDDGQSLTPALEAG